MSTTTPASGSINRSGSVDRSRSVNKVVLAYSGGLDTSVILQWLKDVYECEVVTYTADLGQGEELEPARAKAIEMGIPEDQIFIDDVPVGDNRGRVNFCGHESFQLYYDPAFQAEGPDFATLEFEMARFGGAHAFNWPVLNLAHGEHEVDVRVRGIVQVLALDDIADEGAMAGFGKRSLIIEPVHLKVDETLGDDG